MPASLLRRYFVFLLVTTIVVVSAEQGFQLYFLNTTGRAETRHALTRYPALAGRVGNPRLGFAWRGNDPWWIPEPATALIYLPVQGERENGTLYLREEGQQGSWVLRRISFRADTSKVWTVY